MELNIERRKPDCPHNCALIRETDDPDNNLYVCHQGTILGPEVSVEVVIEL